MIAAKMSLQRVRGFTLIESIIAMVVMGIAMVMLFTLFFPRVEDSGRAQYLTRGSALGQSVMNTILSRSFDENSDPSGGIYRCDETDADGKDNPCSDTLQADTDETTASDYDDETTASDYDDVDDYVGCWSQPAGNSCSDLKDLIYNAEQYTNFTVNVDVEKVNSETVSEGQPTNTQIMKKITVTISSQRYEPFKMVAYRGNY
ncbi:type IV pilus modification PilV family protein [Vibrio aphrogenes]|uniref:type IV pilus modification PilV family protein n=1 Tax=Vibrio aphrogenes TaxID=1891186 RepID=UPI001E48B588|nr:type II secretion system protein [Vibrio aphrogenes]